MIELQASGLTLVFAHVAAGEAVRFAQSRPSLMISVSPVALLRGEEIPATTSAVFAQLSAGGEALAQTRVQQSTPLLIVRAEDEALVGALYAARLIEGSVYVPPGVLVALLNAARLAASPGGLPQHTLMALIAVLKGWVQSLPRLLRSVRREVTGQRAPELRLLRLAQRIEVELGMSLSSRTPLVQLAREVHSSQAQLTRAFRAVHGMTIANYRRELRLRAALNALLDDSRRCDLIAREVGYRSASQFSVDFRDLFGVAPSRVVSLVGSLAPPGASAPIVATGSRILPTQRSVG